MGVIVRFPRDGEAWVTLGAEAGQLAAAAQAFIGDVCVALEALGRLVASDEQGTWALLTVREDDDRSLCGWVPGLPQHQVALAARQKEWLPAYLTSALARLAGNVTRRVMDAARDAQGEEVAHVTFTGAEAELLRLLTATQLGLQAAKAAATP